MPAGMGKPPVRLPDRPLTARLPVGMVKPPNCPPELLKAALKTLFITN
jgi:hypothetical protein